MNNYFQAICKYSCINDLKQVFTVAQFIDGVHANSPYQQICTKYMDITAKIIKFAILLYAILFFSLAMGPIIYYLVTGEMTPAMPIYLPNMNTDTFSDFLLVICVHSAILLAAVCFVAASDTLTFIIFVNMFMVAMVIVDDIKELGSALKQQEYCPMKCKLRLIQIIRMHKTYSE